MYLRFSFISSSAACTSRLPRRGCVAGGSRRGRLARLGCAERARRRLSPFQRRRRSFPPPFSACCGCYGAALGRGSGGPVPRGERRRGQRGPGDGTPRDPPLLPPPPPHGEGAARKALSGGPGSGCAAGLIKHCICIALRYPPDWSCSGRRLFIAGPRCSVLPRRGGTAEAGAEPRAPAAPARAALAACAGRGSPNKRSRGEKKKKKNYGLPFSVGVSELIPRAKYSGRTGSAHSPSPPLVPRCVSTASYHGGSRPGRSRPRPPGPAPRTPPV